MAVLRVAEHLGEHLVGTPEPRLTIKNTFVNGVEPTAKERFRKLRPHLSCSDVPDPLRFATGLDPVVPPAAAAGAVAEAPPCSREEQAYTGACCGDDEKALHCDPRKRIRSQDGASPEPPLPAPERARQPSTPVRVVGPHREGRLFPWTFSAQKLQGGDRVIVSPPIEVPLGGEGAATFRLVIAAKGCGDRAGGTSFRKSKGWGTVEVKCEALPPSGTAELSFRVWVGSGGACKGGGGQQEARGPVHHDFGRNAVSGLPKEAEHWNLSAAIDRESSTLTVCLEQLLPLGEAEPSEAEKSAAPSPAGAVETPQKPAHPRCAAPGAHARAALEPPQEGPEAGLHGVPRGISEAKERPHAPEPPAVTQFMHALSSGHVRGPNASFLMAGISEIDWSSSSSGDSSDDDAA